MAQRLPLLPLCGLLLDVRPRRSGLNHHLVVAKSKKQDNLQGNNILSSLSNQHTTILHQLLEHPPCHYVCFIIFRGLSIFTKQKGLERIWRKTSYMLVKDKSNGALASVRCISDCWIGFRPLLVSSSSACFWTRACLFKSISWFYLV